MLEVITSGGRLPRRDCIHQRARRPEVDGYHKTFAVIPGATANNPTHYFCVTRRRMKCFGVVVGSVSWTVTVVLPPLLTLETTCV